MLIAIPWTLLAVSLTFFITIYVIEVPESVGKSEMPRVRPMVCFAPSYEKL